MEYLFLVDTEGLAEALVEFQRNDRFRQLVQVSAEDVGGIVNRVSGPIQALSVTFGRVEYFLEILDTLGGPIESEDTLDISCFTRESAVINQSGEPGKDREPFSFKKTPHLATTIGTYP